MTFPRFDPWMEIENSKDKVAKVAKSAKVRGPKTGLEPTCATCATFARAEAEKTLRPRSAMDPLNFQWALIDGKMVTVPDGGRTLWDQHKDRPGVICFDPMTDGANDEAFEAFLKRYGLKKRALH